ncbi:hypothetical protein MFRU_003g02710 [Monilinia fructicola]|nr:hypothetical protein MFRU_003g02710 [Monilinia fructicola]
MVVRITQQAAAALKNPAGRTPTVQSSSFLPVPLSMLCERHERPILFPTAVTSTIPDNLPCSYSRRSATRNAESSPHHPRRKQHRLPAGVSIYLTRQDHIHVPCSYAHKIPSTSSSQGPSLLRPGKECLLHLTSMTKALAMYLWPSWIEMRRSTDELAIRLLLDLNVQHDCQLF